MEVLYYNRAINTMGGPSAHARELLNALLKRPIGLHIYPSPTRIDYKNRPITPKSESNFLKFLKEIGRLSRGAVHTFLDFTYISYVICSKKTPKLGLDNCQQENQGYFSPFYLESLIYNWQFALYLSLLRIE